MNNLGQAIANILNLSRKIQSLSADGKHNAEVYELATQLILEAHHIRQATHNINAYAEKTIADIVRNSGGNYG